MISRITHVKLYMVSLRVISFFLDVWFALEDRPIVGRLGFDVDISCAFQLDL